MKYLLQQLILLVFVICTFVNRVKAEVNYAYCSEKYGNLTYIPEAQMFEKYPPHLISFPGSGNSFVRLLIEYSTGFHTGSMGTDDFEYLGDGGFIGERSCGLRLAALRAHPHYFDFLNGKLRFGHNFQRDKCKRGLVREMKRLIMLVRNPYDSLWSYYQLLTSLTHKDYVTTETFNPSNWLYLAPIMASYWNSEYYRIVKPIFETYLPEDVTVVKYEDLMNITKREATLQKLLKFMQYIDVPDEKVSCAFLLADKPFVHRDASDPRRVPAKTAFLVSAKPTTAPANPNPSNDEAIVANTVEMTQYKNLLCQMKEPFEGISKYFNYTLAPVSMNTAEYLNLCDVGPIAGLDSQTEAQV